MQLQITFLFLVCPWVILVMHASDIPDLKTLVYQKLVTQLEKTSRKQRSAIIDGWECKAPMRIKSNDQTQNNFINYLEQEYGWRYPQKQFVLKDHANIVHSMALVSQQNKLISSSWDGTLRTWDLLQGKCIQINSCILPGIDTLTANGKYLVNLVCLANNVFKVQSVNDGVIKTFPGKFKSVVPLHSNDVNLLATINSTNEVFIWNLESGTCIAKRTVRAKNVALAANLTKIAYAIKNVLHIEDFNTGISQALLIGHTDKINTLVITPDSKKLISAGRDKTIKIWDLESYQCLNTINGHDASIYKITIACNGKYFISFAHDTTCKIWDLKSGEALKTLSTVEGNLHVVMDEHYLVATSDFALNVYRKANWQEIMERMPEHTKISCLKAIFMSGWKRLKQWL